MSKEIIVQSKLNVKKSTDCKNIQYRATAGISEAEAIKRYTIGEYTEDEKDEESGKEKNKRS